MCRFVVAASFLWFNRNQILFGKRVKGDDNVWLKPEDSVDKCFAILVSSDCGT